MSPDLLKEMLWSAKELHASLERDLLKLEKNKDDTERIDTIYRSFHSLKGAAGLVGLPLFEIVTHEGEALLALYRSHPDKIDSAGVELLITCCDMVKQLMRNLNKDGNEGAVDISDLVVNITSYTECLLMDDSPQVATTAATATAAPTTPPPPVQQPASTAAAVPITEASSDSGYTHTPDTTTSQTPQVPVVGKNTESGSREGRSSAATSNELPNSPQSSTTSRAIESSVRVGIELLDQLMNQVGELVLARNQVLQSVAAIDDPALQATTRVLDQVTSELQESIMQTRMQPISVITDKFPRIVRDLSRQLGKDIELAIEGRETELDRTIVEAVRDPFTHILRNSIDHGLEFPDERESRGKSATGTVTIRAFHESGQVIVEVSDDGRGIDVDRVKAKALERGLITEEQALRMSNAEAANLICHPGLSTAESITNISGRGVGMDVVRSNIEKIGGSLDIQTVRGQGTTMRIKIPLTLAIIPALMVGIGDRLFGIPQVNLIELVGISSDEYNRSIEDVRGAKVFRLRERLLTVVHLDEVLGIDRKPQAESDMLYIVVVAAGDHHFGLIVEDIFDTEEIVVKPMSKHLTAIEQFAGATIRGDGSVSLILDIAGIARAVDMNMQQSNDIGRLGDAHANDAENMLEDDFLVFTLTDKDQYAIPLQLVSRIEQYPASTLTRINGKPAITSNGTILPTIMMNELMETEDPCFEQQDTIYAIVVASGSGVGFVATNLVDITSIRPETILENSHFNLGEMASGAAVLGGKPTILLDVFKLIDQLFPTHSQPGAQVKDGDHRPRILFAEDAPFFQGVVANYLKDAGYDAEVCDDGQQAWDQLNGITSEPYDLILTDLEMPNMNGWKLIESIRTLDDYRQIPIIALTSLTDEESRRRALESGATDYRVKLNRDELLEAMSQALN